MRHVVIEHALFQRPGIFHADHHSGQLGFEHAGRGKIIGRPNLAQVRHHCLGTFRTIHAEPGPVGLTDGKDEIANPGHRQIGQDFVIQMQRIKIRRRLGSLDHVSVGQHHTLGLASGAGCVKHYAGAVVVQLGLARIQVVDKLIISRSTLVLHMAVFMQMRMIVFTQSAWIEVNQMFKLVQIVLHLDHFVHLFLIGNDHEPRAAMTQNISHLFGIGVVVKRHRNCTYHLGGDNRPIQIWAVTSHDSDKIAFVDAQID